MDRLPVSAEEAWRLVADIARWHEWTDQLRCAEALSSPVGEGSRILIQSKMVSWVLSPVKSVRLHIEIEKSTPGRSFVWSGRLMGIFGRHGFEFKPIDAGSCEVIHWEELWGWQTYFVQLFGIWRTLKSSFRVLLNELRNHLSARRIQSQPKVLEVDGSEISYLDVGSGETVIMLHGYPQSHYCWRHQIAEFMDSARLIVPDLLGWGASDRRLDIDYEYEREVEGLIHFIEGLGLARAHLVAHDYGGYLALGMVKRKPELFKSLVILNSRAHRTFNRRWKFFFVCALQAVAQIPIFGRFAPWLPVRQTHKLILGRELRQGIFDAHAEESYFGHLDAGSLGNRWLFHFFARGRGYSFAPKGHLLQDLSDQLRYLVIWGTRDIFLSTDIAEELSTHLPGCQRKLLPDSGHYVMEEAPNEVCAALKDFLFPQPADD